MFDYLIGPNRPVSWTFQFWIVLPLSFVGSFIATMICKRVALKFGITDKPDNLVKTHREPMAYLGGVGIFMGLAAGIFAGFYCVLDMEHFKEIYRYLFGILGGAFISCAIGVIDDIFDIRPLHKIGGQVVAAFFLILVGILPTLNAFRSLLDWDFSTTLETTLGIPIVIFFVLGASNSLNLLDGLDGLCAGVTAIITLALLLLAIHLSTWRFSDVDDPVRIIVCLALVGAVAGFLPFNRHPAKIFMGDAGSILLGFMVAALMMLFAKTGQMRWWLASIMVFGLPILDTATALVRRLVNKRPLFESDRGHIYDQMIDRGLSLHKTVGISYGLTAVFALIGLILSQIKARHAIYIYLILFVIAGLLIWRLGFLQMEGMRGKVKRDEERGT